MSDLAVRALRAGGTSHAWKALWARTPIVPLETGGADCSGHATIAFAAGRSLGAGRASIAIEAARTGWAGLSLFASGSPVTRLALGSFGTWRSRGTVLALVPLVALFSLRAGRPVAALGTARAGLALGAAGPGRALLAVGAGGTGLTGWAT